MRYQSYVILVFIVAGLVAGVSVQAGVVSAFAQFSVPDSQLLGLLNISTLAAIGFAILTFGILLRNTKATRYTDEVVGELAKVTWPSKDETIKASTTVVVVTLLFSGLLGLYDLLWKNLADYFLFS